MDWEIIFWVALAALAFVGELLTVSFFLLFFSLGAVVGLVAAVLGFGITVQAVGFLAASVLSMVILRPAFLNRLALGEGYLGHRGITGKRAVVTKQKATSCDLCTDHAEPSCVYACPHDAAHRVEPKLAPTAGREMGKGQNRQGSRRTREPNEGGQDFLSRP